MISQSRGLAAALSVVAALAIGEVAFAQTTTGSTVVSTGGAAAGTTTTNGGSAGFATTGRVTTGTTATTAQTDGVTIRTVPTGDGVRTTMTSSAGRTAPSVTDPTHAVLLARASTGDLTPNEISTSAQALADALGNGLTARDVRLMTAADLQRLVQARGFDAATLAPLLVTSQATIYRRPDQVQTRPSEITPARVVVVSPPTTQREVVAGEQARRADGVLLRQPQEAAGPDWPTIAAALLAAAIGCAAIAMLLLRGRSGTVVIAERYLPVRPIGTRRTTVVTQAAPDPRPVIRYTPDRPGHRWSIARAVVGARR